MVEKTGEKATPEAIAERSVVKQPPESGGVPSLQTSLLWMAAGTADEIQPWGQNPKLRDRELRAFITTESLFASALGIVCARNGAFSWFLEGSEALSARMQEALETANFGKGWQDLMLKVSVDLYTQDSGAFIEVVRQGDTPDSPLLSLNHLDAQRCWHTGRPEAPVIYQDRDGGYHLLNWWEVLTLSEVPSAAEDQYGMQWCALSRMLLAAQVTRNIAIYQMEKTGGRFTKAIHLVKGMTSSEIQDAVAQVMATADNAGRLRYMGPVVVGSVDPRANLEATTLELASMPEGYDADQMYKWYISQIAMAFLTDYQEFAPLPGGGLGSSAQSQVLHLKSRGKGPGLYMKLIEQALNFKVLPEGVTFGFEEQDLEAEQAEAETKLKRAETRKIKVDSGEVDEQGARQEALDVGDMAQETFDRLSATEDVTPEVTVSDEEREGAKVLAPLLIGLGAKAAPVGQFLATRIHRAFTQSADDLAALGYMDTAGRIQLSGAIGDALKELEKAMGKRVADIVRQNVADEDALALVAQVAEKALAGTEVAGYRPFGWTATATSGKAAEPARAGPFEDERLVAEATLADSVEKSLRRTFARIKRRLRQEYGRTPWPWEARTKELKPGMFDDPAFWGLGKEELMKDTSTQVDGLLRQGASQASRLGLAVNFELVNEQVLDFAGKYSDDWWKHLQKTNRQALRNAIRTNIRQGAPLKSLVKSLEPTFGRTRAEMIASTETTRLYAEGNRMAYDSAGVDLVEWRTVEDDRMCAICRGLSGKRWRIGQEKQVPPAHVRCRCWLAPVVCEEKASKEVIGEKETVCNVLTEVVEEGPAPYMSDVDNLAVRRGSYGEASRSAKESGEILKARWGKDPAFRELAKASQRFGSASTPIREASRAAMQGRVADVAQAARDAARILTKNLRTASVQKKSLWRGISFGPKTSLEELKAAWRVGSTVDVPISSASFGKDVARFFAQAKKRVGFKGKQVVMEFKDTQGLPITAFSRHPTELEALIGGKFKVESVTGRGNLLNIVLRQVASLP